MLLRFMESGAWLTLKITFLLTTASDCGKFFIMKAKNCHAVALGRLGGKAGTGKAKARTPVQARAASMVRWRKYYANKNICAD